MIVGAGRPRGEFGVVRYLPNGALDASFGAEGKVHTAIDSKAPAEATAIALQGDGKMVIGGIIYTSSIDTNFTVVRYNTGRSIRRLAPAASRRWTLEWARSTS